MTATVQAAAQLGQDYRKNLRTTKHTDFEKIKQLFVISQKFIQNQKTDLGHLQSIGIQFHE